MTGANKKSRHRHRASLCGALLTATGAVGAASAQTPLPEQVIGTLNLALADERQAHRDYSAILKRFGEVRPFCNIVHAEARHIDALVTLYARYEASIPLDESVADPDIETLTLKDICQKGVDAEIENVRLYDEELLPAVQDYSDIAAVFQRLRDASADRHLPAFQRCVERGGRSGRGRGRQRS